MYEYRNPYILDFRNIKYYGEIHLIFKDAFDFPHYYGENWSAFWDCLKDMRGEAIHIEIVGLDVIRQNFDDSADKIIEILKRLKHFNDDLFADIIRVEIVDDGKRTEIE